MSHISDEFQKRTARLQQQLTQKQVCLLSTPTDITYFSGFEFLVPEEREAFFIITPNKSFLIKTSFSPLPPEHAHFNVLENCRPEALAHHLCDIFSQENLNELFIDKSSLFVEEMEKIQQKCGERCTLSSLHKEWIWNLRTFKDDQEIQKIRRASYIAVQAFTTVQSTLRPGMTEREVSNMLENEMRKLGASAPAFPTIVAFGERGAAPHYQPCSTPLAKNTSILIDWGATFEGYRSDITRSFWFGDNPNSEFLKIEDIVQRAYKAAVQLFSLHHEQQSAMGIPGLQLMAKDIDAAARSVIAQAGLGEFFIHTTGHGVGLDIHEPPSLNWKNEAFVEPQMVITIEPGIYLEGKWGYRHENTLLVQETGVEELTVI